MEDILREIGWKKGYYIPVANAENQALEVELQKLMIRRTNAKNTYEEARSKFDALTKHLKYVKQESEQNQKLLVAYVQQIEAERHKYQWTKAQSDKVDQDMRTIAKHMDEISERVATKKKDLTRTMEKIEKLKIGTAWDAEALKAWENSVTQRSDDTELLKEFSKLDERKAKELETRRQQLQTEVSEKMMTVEKMNGEIRNYEQMQNRTDKLFKQQEDERKVLINHWQDTVKNLRQRDADIARANDNIQQLQQIIAAKQELLDEENAFLESQKSDNKKINEEIDDLNTLISRMKKELNELVQSDLEMADELKTLKRTLGAAANNLEKERQLSKNQDDEMKMLNKKINNILQDCDDLEKKLAEVQASSMSSTEKATRLGEMINVEENLYQAKLMESDTSQDTLYRHQATLSELQNVMKTIEMEISCSNTASKHLRKQVDDSLHENAFQQENVYDLSYRINEMEVKISGLEGTSKFTEENEKMNIKISQLENSLAEHIDVKNFLQTQVTKLEDEMRRLSNTIIADNERIQILRGKLQDQVMLFEGGVKQTAVAKLKSQQKQVDESVLRLRVSQLGEAISTEETSIYDLQKFRLALETSLKERRIEIETRKEILQAQRKNAEEALGRLRADINRKKIRIEQFQKKHHLALMALGSDEDGQPLSISHFKMKEAQEKSALHDEYDDLNNKVRKAEKEIIAMENTLKVVNMTNDTFRKTMLPSENQESERIELEKVEQEICNTIKTLKEHKKIFGERKKELKQLQEQLVIIQNQWMEEREKLNDLEGKYQNLKQEQVIRDEKIARTLKEVKTYKSLTSGPNLEKPERNIEIRQLQDANKSTLHQLALFIEDHEENKSTVLNSMDHYNLELPPRVKTMATTSSSSTVSLSSSSRRSSCGSLIRTALTPVVMTFEDDKKTK